MTSYALILFLLLWAGLDTVIARRAGRRRAVSCGCWVARSGADRPLDCDLRHVAGRYFGPLMARPPRPDYLLAGESAPRQLFHAAGVPATPLLERLIAFGSVGLALLVLPFGLIALRRALTPLRGMLIFAAVLYVPALPLRLTQAGTEISNRASEFVYVGIAFLAATSLTRNGGCGGRARPAGAESARSPCWRWPGSCSRAGS